MYLVRVHKAIRLLLGMGTTCQIRGAESKALAPGGGEARLRLYEEQPEPPTCDRSGFRERNQSNPPSWPFSFDSSVLSNTDGEGSRDSHSGSRQSSVFIISGECSSLCSSVPSVPRLCQRCLERSYQGLLSAQYCSINHQERGDAKTFSNYDCKNSKGKWGAVTGEIKEKIELEIQGNLSNGKSYWNDFCCTRRRLSLAPHLRKR